MHDVTHLLLSWRQGRRSGTRPPGPARLRRAAPGGAPPSSRRISGARPSGDRTRSRGLPATGRRRPHDTDEPGALLRRGGHLDAPDPRQSCPPAAHKRGGGVTVLSLDEASPAAWTSSVDVLALDEALDALCAIDARQCQVVELRFFAGLKKSTKRRQRSGYRQRRWSASGRWRKPGSFGDSRHKESDRSSRGDARLDRRSPVGLEGCLELIGPTTSIDAQRVRFADGLISIDSLVHQKYEVVPRSGASLRPSSACGGAIQAQLAPWAPLNDRRRAQSGAASGGVHRERQLRRPPWQRTAALSQTGSFPVPSNRVRVLYS